MVPLGSVLGCTKLHYKEMREDRDEMAKEECCKPSGVKSGVLWAEDNGKLFIYCRSLIACNCISVTELKSPQLQRAQLINVGSWPKPSNKGVAQNKQGMEKYRKPYPAAAEISWGCCVCSACVKGDTRGFTEEH